MTVTHRCPDCACFATSGGFCPDCDVLMVPLAAADEKTPCPDLDTEDPDLVNVRSPRRAPRKHNGARTR